VARRQADAKRVDQAIVPVALTYIRYLRGQSLIAKLTLIGQPQELAIVDGVATFRIVAGPASSTAPKGLPLFTATTYVVRCSQRQLNRGRAGDGDKSDLVIEGYQKPRVDENGKPYIAVIATAVASKNLQAGRKLEQLREDAGKAEDAYNAACDQYGEDSAQATAAFKAFEGVKANLIKFLSGHPELKAE
jgi:hypothetical protein